MARDTTDQTPLSSVTELTDYLAAGCRAEADFRIGTEHEKFAFFRKDNSPVPYFGEASISALLKGMQEKLGWEPIMDGENIIGLGEQHGMGAISIEPGGQFELSGAPLENLHQTCKDQPASGNPAGSGRADGHPFPRHRRQPAVDFRRDPAHAEIALRDHDALHAESRDQGSRHDVPHLHHQVNLDFSSEADMRQKMRVSMKLQSLATALFASSPFTEGKPNGLLSWRGDIWRDTDNRRSGVLPFTFSDDFGFKDYVEWALDVPMYFIVRDGKYHDCTHVTFRQFMNGALKGEIAAWEPTMGDWTNHLSTLFPDVRLKRFLEMRGADGGPWRRICALPAFWVGLLYNQEALDAADALTADWSFDEVIALRNAVPAKGLAAEIAGKPLLGIARQVLDISRTGLKNRKRLNGEGQDETVFLSSLDEVLAKKTTLAEDLLALYNGRWGGSVVPVFEEYQY